MKELTFALIAVGLSIVSGVALHLNHVDVVSIIQFIFIENILLLVLQTFIYVRGEDPYLGEAARTIRRFDRALPLCKSILGHTVAALSNNNEVVQRKALEFMTDLNASLASLTTGVVEIDLRPGGGLFRELHAVEYAKETYRATTCAEPASYWMSAAGKSLLLRNKRAVENGVKITRIFIHPAGMLPELRRAIEDNLAVGVRVFFADWDGVNGDLRRDFALCDDGVLGVELRLDAEMRPERAQFFIPGAPAADQKINQLSTVWRQLLGDAKEIDKNLLRELDASGAIIRPSATA